MVYNGGSERSVNTVMKKIISKILGTFCGLFVIWAALSTSIGTNTFIYLIIFTPPMIYFMYALWFKKAWYEEVTQEKEHNQR